MLPLCSNAVMSRPSSGYAVFVSKKLLDCQLTRFKRSVKNSSYRRAFFSFSDDAALGQLRAPSRQSVDFEERRGAHAASDAHRDARTSRLAAAGPRAARGPPAAHRSHPNGWPIAIAAAIDVQPISSGMPSYRRAVDRLRGEGLVNFPQVDILDLQTVGASSSLGMA